MAAHGRGPDSTLVHMSPREVQGLQAIAMRHGGSLTINPQTGLPEAGILENLLPAIAGFALNAFAPGAGTAVGSALGLTGSMASTVGTGLLVGGVTGLASGSLEKGLMAGLGAYGGAGLGDSLNTAGKSALEAASSAGSGRGAFLPGAETSPSGTLDRLKAGLGSFSEAPADAFKNNALNLGLASAPLLAGTFDDQSKSGASKIHPGYIRVFDDSGRQVEAVKADEWGSRPVMKWGQVPPTAYGANGGLMQHYDDGGTTTDEIKKGVTQWGRVGELEPIITRPQDMGLSDSERAQRYLMGDGPNPFLFYHKPVVVDPIAKAAEATKSLQEEIAKGQTESRGLSMEQRAERDDPNSWANIGEEAQAQYYADNPTMASLVQFGQKLFGYTPIGQLQDKDFVARQKLIAQGFSPSSGLSYVTPQSYLNAETGAPMTPSSPAVIDKINKTDFSGMDKGSYKDPAPVAPPTNDFGNQNFWSGNDMSSISGGSGSRDAGGNDGSGATNSGDNGGWGSRDAGGNYAHGGGIAALAQGGYNLGSYSDGGRLLRGPGDGVSDDIPATIGQNQPARLADGEFVVPARIVSELGNGSTEAGARKLYAMMDRVQKARSKTVGKDKVAANSRADKYLPS